MDSSLYKVVNRLGVVASVAVLMSVTACGSTNSKTDTSALDEIQARQDALDKREKELKLQADALASERSALNNAASAQPVNMAGSELLPPNAKPGECYTRVWQPARYTTQQEQRLVSEAGERIEIIPAKYGKVTKQVLVQEASSRIVTVPATYKTVTERVMVQDAQTVVEQVPPVYETVSERILDKPAHTTWKKGTGPIQRIDDTTGEIMCLVEVPATYKTVTKRVLKTAATTRSRTIPAQYKTVTKRVVDQPASTKTIEIPAKYKTVTVTEEIRPAEQKRIPIPAKYKTVSTQKLQSEGHMAWREILCETNTTRDRVASIQSALKKAGFNPGPIDGSLGAGTMKAVNAFQRAKGLPVDRYLNVETVKALGVSTK